MAREALAAQTNAADAHLLEQVVLNGDLSRLTPEDRVNYYARVCESLGLNPLTRPFQYLTLNGKLILYASKDCTEQLRRNKSVSITITAREIVEDVYVVTARATMPDGRTDESTGAVAVGGLKGEARANALMKAETKAKRRVTLSIGGLGWLDETEVSTIPDARAVSVDYSTGEIIDEPAAHAPHPQAQAPKAQGGETHMAGLRKSVTDLLRDYYGSDKSAIAARVAEIVGHDGKWADLTEEELKKIQFDLGFSTSDETVPA